MQPVAKRCTHNCCKSDKVREVELMVLKREVGGRDLPHSLTLDQFLEPSAERDFWPTCWNEACKIRARSRACRSRFFVACRRYIRRHSPREHQKRDVVARSNPNLGKRLSLSHFYSQSARMQTKSAWGEFASDGYIEFIHAPLLIHRRAQALFPVNWSTQFQDDWRPSSTLPAFYRLFNRDYALLL
jgi:hypothetical protein